MLARSRGTCLHSQLLGGEVREFLQPRSWSTIWMTQQALILKKEKKRQRKKMRHQVEVSSVSKLGVDQYIQYSKSMSLFSSSGRLQEVFLVREEQCVNKIPYILQWHCLIVLFQKRCESVPHGLSLASVRRKQIFQERLCFVYWKYSHYKALEM